MFLTTEVMGEYLSVGGSLISLVEEGNEALTCMSLIIISLIYIFKCFLLIYLGVLEYSNPADKMKYAFDPKTGLLLHMQSIGDRSNITLLYSSTRKDKPSMLLHSNGKKLKVTYNLNGAISTLDILDAADNIEQTWYVCILAIYTHFVRHLHKISGTNIIVIYVQVVIWLESLNLHCMSFIII